MVSLIHLTVFIIIWPVIPFYIIYVNDIESWFLRFVICGAFGPLAFLGSSLVTLAISPEDRRQSKARWEADDKKMASKVDNK